MPPWADIIPRNCGPLVCSGSELKTEAGVGFVGGSLRKTSDSRLSLIRRHRLSISERKHKIISRCFYFFSDVCFPSDIDFIARVM